MCYHSTRENGAGHGSGILIAILYGYMNYFQVLYSYQILLSFWMCNDPLHWLITNLRYGIQY